MSYHDLHARLRMKQNGYKLIKIASLFWEIIGYGVAILVILILQGCAAEQKKINTKQLVAPISPYSKTVRGSLYIYPHIELRNLFFSNPISFINKIEINGVQYLRSILDNLQKNIGEAKKINFQLLDDKEGSKIVSLSKPKIILKFDSSQIEHELINDSPIAKKIVIVKVLSPQRPTEPYYVAMVLNNIESYRYFVLQKTTSSYEKNTKFRAVLCEWTLGGLHKNHGVGLKDPTPKGLLDLVNHVIETTPSPKVFFSYFANIRGNNPEIKRKKYSEEDENKILKIINNQHGQSKECTINFIDQYRRKLLEHCLKEGAGKNVIGGCYHIIRSFLHTAVFEVALDECNIQWEYELLGIIRVRIKNY